MRAKLDTALEALQLSLKLLPPSSREELRRLLTFMSSAAEPGAVKVDKEVKPGGGSELGVPEVCHLTGRFVCRWRTDWQ